MKRADGLTNATGKATRKVEDEDLLDEKREEGRGEGKAFFVGREMSRGRSISGIVGKLSLGLGAPKDRH